VAAKLGNDDDDLVSDINITPFVDIILVVLIIFMVTATTIVRQAIEVKLPEAASGATAEETSLALTIDAQLRWYLDGAPTTESELRTALRAAKAEKGDKVVCLLAADRTVPHGEVVHLIDVIKQEGIAKFALNIDPVPKPDGAP
jgi:biopolymer transport protein ExbD